MKKLFNIHPALLSSPNQLPTENAEEPGASGLTVNTVAASPQPTPAPPPITPSIKKVDDSIHLEFQSIAGRSYLIEWTDDLVAGRWTVLTQEAIGGNGEMMKVIDAGAGTQKQGFYRVVETQTAAMMKP